MAGWGTMHEKTKAGVPREGNALDALQDDVKEINAGSGVEDSAARGNGSVQVV